MQDSAALLAKVARKKRVVAGKLKGSEKAEIEQLVATGKVIKLGQAFYSAECAPSEETEADRIEQLLLSKPKLFPRGRLETRLAEVKPFFRVALANLVRVGRVLELERVVATTCLYIHREHIVQFHSERSDQGKDLTTLSELIRAAYRTVSERYERRSIFISDLLSESCLDFATLSGWIEHEIIKEGRGQLDEGDWSEANDEQRGAAVDFLGRKRLYIALTP
ncbi:MAG: hypothetical protein JO308_18040 [Verrucomicrobia bacterium]|nr:hypothetical protein [Verrucomicrobiota bacterium]